MAAHDKDTALKSLATRLGGSVRLANGEVFNADGERTVIKSAKVETKSAPSPTDELLRAVIRMLEQQKPASVVMPELPAPIVNVEPAQVTVHPAPIPKVTPMSWKFTFERNESGTIRSITATPQT